MLIGDGALIGDEALIGYRALIRIFTVTQHVSANCIMDEYDNPTNFGPYF